MRRIAVYFCALAVALTAALATASTAAAQYPVETGTTTLLSGTPAPGETVTVAGCCFVPGSTTTVAAEGSYEELLDAEADASGYVEVTVYIPVWADRLILFGPDPDGGELRLILELLDTGVLPVTGDAIGDSVVKPALIGAAAFVLVGGVLVAARKRAKTA